MKDNLIITIGREFGSGGRAIGQMVAEKLDIAFYDKELIAMAADDSGLSKEIIESNDEKPFNSFFYSLAMDARSAFGQTETSINQKAFLAQFNTIKKLAKEGPCVIVGRCADYALSDHENLISIFITADMEEKISIVSSLRGISKDKALDLIQKTNKKRANYYNYYTNRAWGASGNYDLCINSSRTGYDGAAELIIKYSQIKEKLLEIN